MGENAEIPDAAEAAESGALKGPFVLHVVYQAAEVNEAQWLYFREEGAARYILGAFILSIFGTIFLLIFTAGAMRGLILHLISDGVWANALKQTGLFLVCLAPFAFTFKIWQLMKAHHMTAYQRDARFRLPVLYIVASEGFQILLPHATVLVDWKNIACFEVPDSLCLVSGYLIFPLPKRCFISAEQLQQVRQLIIGKGVRYGRVGRQKRNVTYTGAPISLVFDIRKTAIQPVQSIQQILPIVAGNHITPKHSDSSLISEPNVWQMESQVLRLECNFTLRELKRLDDMLFCKYQLSKLGLSYLAVLAYCVIVPAGFVYIFSAEAGARVLSFFLYGTPLLLLGSALHIWYVRDKRIENLIEAVTNDLPFIVEISNNDCRKISRRSILVYQWHDFLGCFATKDYYICPLRNGSVIIPKKLLTNRTEAAFVEDLLRRKITKFEVWD